MPATRLRRSESVQDHIPGDQEPGENTLGPRQQALNMDRGARPVKLTALDPWAYETKAAAKGHITIAGIDEAGRGPLAGPVVSAAVVLPRTFSHSEVTDSKKLSPARRSKLYDVIYEHAVAIGIGIVDAAEIDRINILQAALLSMAIAALNLEPSPDCLLIDGTFPIPLPTQQITIAKGDTLSISISAASIVAKVTRDRLMDCYDGYYPHYNFKSHKGYPTKAHREAIRKFGSSPIHRHSFKGVREYTQPPKAKQLPLGAEHAESKTEIR